MMLISIDSEALYVTIRDKGFIRRLSVELQGPKLDLKKRSSLSHIKAPLRELLRKINPKSREVLLILPDSEFTFKEITIPSNMKLTTAALKVSLRKALNGDPLNFWLTYRRSPGAINVIAISKERGEELKNLLREFKLELIGLVPRTLSLALLRDDPESGYLFIDSTGTHIGAYRKGFPITGISLPYPLHVFKYSPNDPVFSKAFLEISRAVRSVGVTTKQPIKKIIVGTYGDLNSFPGVKELSGIGLDMEIFATSEDRLSFVPEEHLLKEAEAGRVDAIISGNQLLITEESQKALNILKVSLLLAVILSILSFFSIKFYLSSKERVLRSTLASLNSERERLIAELSGEREEYPLPFQVFQNVTQLANKHGIFIKRLTLRDNLMRFEMVALSYRDITEFSRELGEVSSEKALKDIFSKKVIKEVKLATFSEIPIYTFTLYIPVKPK